MVIYLAQALLKATKFDLSCEIFFTTRDFIEILRGKMGSMTHFIVVWVMKYLLGNYGA
jgi:hypothetical protein